MQTNKQAIVCLYTRQASFSTVDGNDTKWERVAWSVIGNKRWVGWGSNWEVPSAHLLHEQQPVITIAILLQCTLLQSYFCTMHIITVILLHNACTPIKSRSTFQICKIASCYPLRVKHKNGWLWTSTGTRQQKELQLEPKTGWLGFDWTINRRKRRIKRNMVIKVISHQI